MRLMKAKAVVHIYEKHWRPRLVRVVSTLSDSEEDVVVDRHLSLERRPKILDLCCGSARASRRWVDRGARVLGIDRSAAMLREARRQCPSDSLVLVQGDVVAPLAASATFDAVLCFAALHLFQDPAAVVRAAAAAARPGGLFLAWVLTTRGTWSGRLTHALASTVGLYPTPPRELAAIVQRCGFEVIDEQRYGAIELITGRRRA
jgi:SAM-dependent methyltransferase